MSRIPSPDLCSTHEALEYDHETLEYEESELWGIDITMGKQIIPLRPITLIYGLNGAGKTRLLKDILEHPDVLSYARNCVTFSPCSRTIREKCLELWGILLAFEHPECLLHPKAQLEMGDLFVTAANNGNIVLAETHSECILLRIKRRIRRKELNSDDVTIIYIENGRYIHLQMDSAGDFINRWPGGFFEEGFNEVFDMEEIPLMPKVV